MYRLDEIQDKYKEKLITADEAASKVENNMRVHFGLGIGAVNDLDVALSKRDDLRGVEILSTVAIHAPWEVYKKGYPLEYYRFGSAHFTGADRKMASDGRCWYIPMNFNELTSYWEHNDCNIDIAMLSVCPMDEYGFFNLGPQVADVWGVVKSAKMVILEVNEKMPKALGLNNKINLAHVDYVVESSNQPMATIPNSVTTEIDEKIARQVVEKIHSDSTIQLGIGALPSTIGKLIAESDIQNLSGHTEMLVDGYLELFKAGKLTSSKELNNGKLVYSFAGGTQELYDFIDDNSLCYCAPVDYVNNQAIIARMDNFVSVNSCIIMDLYGQICSESSNFKHISGTGGQLDFVQGAYHSKGGQSFICTPSTKVLNGERMSLITAAMKPGYIVTTPRSCTHYVVTEFGAVNLKGKSTWERAELLVSIAHPDFQDELIAEAEKMGIWTTTSKSSY